MEAMQQIWDLLRESLETNTFVKLTLSKPRPTKKNLRNIYVRLVDIKGELQLSCTYHYETSDEVRNFILHDGINALEDQFKNTFKILTLLTTTKDHVVKINKKGNASIISSAATFSEPSEIEHDRQKEKRAGIEKAYLQSLRVTDMDGKVIPKMADKYKQINKYLEVMESLLKDAVFKGKVTVVDMGSGKGYLTFALYDFMKNTLKLDVEIKGIELREELVEHCNSIAKECGYEGLSFEKNSIQDFKADKIDVLIALHACDTATDDAIAQGIKANSQVIVCAPCCHKALRKQLKGVEHENPVLKYGIFKERQFEMVTDTIRALLLEKNAYQTKVFEFVSNEHTRKNIMLTAVKVKKPAVKAINAKLKSVKEAYQIDSYYLEGLI